MSLPPPIRSNQAGSFPWRVLAQRHPELLRQIKHASPYGPQQHQRLDDLLASITTGVIQPLSQDAPDAERWNRWIAPYAGQSWFDVPFLVAENVFYRRLLEAVGYFEPGPWQGIDPFGHLKSAELQSLDVAESADGQSRLLAAVWGNQADLGFRITAEIDARSRGQATSSAAGLVADDSRRIWERLRGTPSSTVLIVADNAGRELAADLLLTDHLLGAGMAARVSLHVKPSPYFVSDATTADVVQCLRAIEASGGHEVAQRLKAAAAQDMLIIRTHPFYVAPLTFHHAPAELTREYARAGLVILKGDLNYRRLVGDCHWPATTDFASVTAYFGGPVAVLRTLKSDVVVGLDRPVLHALDATGQPWRTDGTHALIQARL